MPSRMTASGSQNRIPGDTFRWGVAGPGIIARRFASGMRQIPDGEIVAVASRDRVRADVYADEVGAGRRYGAYVELAEDPDVDIVYVATTPANHAELTVLYLEHGKHVLCEKPFALNLRQVEQMANAAAANDRFLMEAMWSRFLPAYVKLRELLQQRVIGEPLLVEADFGFLLEYDPTHRLLDPGVGGGALLDLGVYPLQLAMMVLGPPDGIAAAAHLGESGVDEAVAAALHHPGGTLAVVKAAVNTPLACTARIAGAHGSIELPAFMHCPERLVVRTLPLEVAEHQCPIDGEGLHYQVLEVHRCLRAGLTQSPTMSLEDSRHLAGACDEIRRQIGLVYPGEAVS